MLLGVVFVSTIVIVFLFGLLLHLQFPFDALKGPSFRFHTPRYRVQVHSITLLRCLTDFNDVITLDIVSHKPSRVLSSRALNPAGSLASLQPLQLGRI